MKLFRNNRNKSLTNSKFSKYLLYASGEVLLIVIGIFIAVQLNNWNAQKEDDMRTEKLLENMRSELLSNIYYANYFMPFYKLQDSMSAQIINNKLTIQDFKNNPDIVNDVFLNISYPYNDNSFLTLKEHLEDIPEELTTAYSFLRYLYVSLYDTKKSNSKLVTEFTLKYNENLMKTKDWAHKRYTENKPDEYYDYLANDPYFKNAVAEIWGLNQTYDFRTIEIIKKYSISAYEEITNATFNIKNIDSTYNYYQEQNFKSIIGNYANKVDSSLKAFIYYKDNKLFYKDNEMAETQFMYANDSLFSGNNGYFYTFKKKNDSIFLGFRKQRGLEMIEYIKQETIKDSL